MAKKKKYVRRGRAFWAKTVEDFAESGETLAAFARKKSLKPTTLGRWVRMLGPEKKEALVRSELIEIVSSTSAHPQMTTGPTRLQVGGAAVEFSDLPPVPYIAELLRAVSTC